MSGECFCIDTSDFQCIRTRFCKPQGFKLSEVCNGGVACRKGKNWNKECKVFDVASLDFVRYMEGPKPLRMFLDVAVPETGAPIAAWSKGYTGKDVIIGIVDTGIDWKHGDFWFDESKTRSKILYIWDQTDDTGPSPALYGYGTEWTKTDIEDGICTETDDNGHGTLVAGIAASSGKETGNYTGMAPDAYIIFVKYNESIGLPAYIDGWNYIVRKAHEVGKPCVISCSFGSLFSSHDEFDPFAIAADWIVSQGVQVVCSAGNEGDWPVHATIQKQRRVIWYDDFESGLGNWTTYGTPTWHIVDTRWTSYNHSVWPGNDSTGLYENNQVSIMEMKDPIDLSGTTYPIMAFQLWPDIEFYLDYLHVDVSSDGGNTWREAWFYSDEDANWRGMLVDLTPYKSDNVKVRFRFESDSSVTYEGPYIDDVVIYDQTDDCGGTYSPGDTYKLEVALDPLLYYSIVDLYYDLGDNISINVSTGNCWVQANEANASVDQPNCVIMVFYAVGPNWKNYFIYAYDIDPSLNETIEINVNNVNYSEGVNRWDAWTLPLWGNWLGYFRDSDDTDYFKSVGSPASSLTCMAVGAYTTKECWNSTDGNTYCYLRAKNGTLAYFSSHGPTRMCRMKPELTAPGYGVVSALSSDASILDVYIVQDEKHWIAGGTSCSAPMVAGAIALYLDAYPNADPSTIRHDFMMNAREDNFTGKTWPDVENPYWGAGKLGFPKLPLKPFRVPSLTLVGTLALASLITIVVAIRFRRF